MLLLIYDEPMQFQPTYLYFPWLFLLILIADIPLFTLHKDGCCLLSHSDYLAIAAWNPPLIINYVIHHFSSWIDTFVYQNYCSVFVSGSQQWRIITNVLTKQVNDSQRISPFSFFYFPWGLAKGIFMFIFALVSSLCLDENVIKSTLHFSNPFSLQRDYFWLCKYHLRMS